MKGREGIIAAGWLAGTKKCLAIPPYHGINKEPLVERVIFSR